MSDLLVEPGSLGHTMGPLRPAGRVKVGDRSFSATSDGHWIRSDEDMDVVRATQFVEINAEPAWVTPMAVDNQ